MLNQFSKMKQNFILGISVLLVTNCHAVDRRSSRGASLTDPESSNAAAELSDKFFWLKRDTIGNVQFFTLFSLCLSQNHEKNRETLFTFYFDEIFH